MEHLNKVKQLERSPMKLVRSIFYKVTTENKDHYVLEQAYASKFDGRIDLLYLDEYTYELESKLGGRTEEVEFKDAKDYIQKYIMQKIERELTN